MKHYQGVYVRNGKVVARIDMYTDSDLTDEQAVKRFESQKEVKVGEYNPAFDVTVDRVELIKEDVDAVVIEPEVH